VLERDFAVILLDVNMPGMDGLETAALIRKRGRSAHIPIIFVTADFNDDHHMAKGYALGAVDYIASPVVPEILRAKVKVFVDLYLLAQQAQRQAQEHIALAEEKVARQAAEQATRRLAFIAQASVALAGSLDLAAIMRELAGLCVPFLADVCVLTLAAEKGESASTEVAWMSEDSQLGLLRRSDSGRRAASSTPMRCPWQPIWPAVPPSRSITPDSTARCRPKIGVKTNSWRC
jgi:CheY-like chemotaxis protein